MPFWASDFISSRSVQMMNTEQVGIYTLWLLNEWTDGPLPLNEDELAGLAKLKQYSSNAKAVLDKCFVKRGGGFINEKLEAIRDEQLTAHNKRVAAGKRGAKLKQSYSNAKAKLKQPDTDTDPEPNIPPPPHAR
jgi:uncharacterized protein YdaU (DUF1376 family)